MRYKVSFRFYWFLPLVTTRPIDTKGVDGVILAIIKVFNRRSLSPLQLPGFVNSPETFSKIRAIINLERCLTSFLSVVLGVQCSNITLVDLTVNCEW